MPWSYEPLWHLLVSKKMKKIDLLRAAKLNTAAVTHMGKDLPVTMNTLDKICNTLNCRIEDIVVHIPGDVDGDE